MNLQSIRQFARGVRTLITFFAWQDLWRFARQAELTVVSKLPKARVLVLAPHPDDEVFGCGGTLAKLRRAGSAITVLYLCDGACGTASGKRNTALITTRKKEARAGLDFLAGKCQTVFWGVPDGSLRTIKKTVARLVEQLTTIQPSLIFTPWFGDEHPDHRATTALLLAALRSMPRLWRGEVWQYEVWTPLVPNRLVPIAAVAEQKSKAITAHRSQLGSRSYKEAIEGLNRYRGALHSIKGPAEAFWAMTQKAYLKFHDKSLTRN